jgi:hypothetical protein
MTFGTWNVESLYREVSLMTFSRKVSKQLRFSGGARGQMGGQWHLFLWKGVEIELHTDSLYITESHKQ